MEAAEAHFIILIFAIQLIFVIAGQLVNQINMQYVISKVVR